MTYYRALTTFDSAGLRTVNIGFQPIGYKISVGSKFGVTDTLNHVFVGGSDGTRQHCIGHYDDSTGRQTFTTTGRVIMQKERVAGVISDVLVAVHDSMQPTGPRINITTPNGNYQVIIEAWG